MYFSGLLGLPYRPCFAGQLTQLAAQFWVPWARMDANERSRASILQLHTESLAPTETSIIVQHYTIAYIQQLLTKIQATGKEQNSDDQLRRPVYKILL
jgi:hypothetical protein